MSYELIYDKCFIKAEKDNKEVFFPMILTGSNNCYDACSRKRERSWHNLTYVLGGKKRYGTQEEMLASVEAERLRIIERTKEYNETHKDYSDEYSDDRWGYFTSVSFGGGCKSTFGQYKGLFITGCKKALTVEELAELGVCVYLHTGSFYYMEEELKRFEKAGKKEIYHTVNTSKELIEKLEEFDEYLKDFPKVNLYINISADEKQMARVRKQKFPTKKTKPTYKEVEKYFVIHVGGYGYFCRRSRRGLYHSPYNTAGKAFETEKQAKAYCKKLYERFGTLSTEVEEVNQKITIKV